MTSAKQMKAINTRSSLSEQLNSVNTGSRRRAPRLFSLSLNNQSLDLGNGRHSAILDDTSSSASTEQP
jgi:hypothetical protein